MIACAIRYRLDGPGPATLLIEFRGELRLYARGVLGGPMPRNHLLAAVTERGGRWVPATGSIDVALDPPAPQPGEQTRSFLPLAAMFTLGVVDDVSAATC